MLSSIYLHYFLLIFETLTFGNFDPILVPGARIGLGVGVGVRA